MTTADLHDVLQGYVGAVLSPRKPAQDLVNEPMIRHWVEATGTKVEHHLDDAAARLSGRSGPVAPATMVQVWTQRGYRAHQELTAGRAPRHDGTLVLDLLAEHGLTAVVATDSEFAFHRELVVGDQVSMEEVLVEVSAQKTTRLGTGFFLTAQRSYRDQHDDLVATQRWTTFRFRPAAPEPPAEPRPDRPAPALNDDNRFWFEAAAEDRLLIQQCGSCAELRHPPAPMCGHCQSLEWSTVQASGDGVIDAVTVAHHPPHPAFDYPLTIAVVELAEGTRLISNLVGPSATSAVVGDAVRVTWIDAGDGTRLPVFELKEPHA